jgi:1,2-diacylglycerol 3-alpha-glucosyltransferase
VRSLGLEASVLFVGNMDRDTELLDCYAAADVFVFASRTETQGLVLLEAMAQGTPVVSTAVMGTAEVLAGTSGSVVVEERSEAFVAAITSLLRDPVRRAALSAAARVDAAGWSSRAMANKLVSLYESVTQVCDVTPLSSARHRSVAATAENPAA